MTVLFLYYEHLLFLDGLVGPAAGLLEGLGTLGSQDGRGTAQGCLEAGRWGFVCQEEIGKILLNTLMMVVLQV